MKHMFAEHLTEIVEHTNGITRRTMVLKGTENIPRFRGYPEPKGVAIYGTKKVGGVSCLKVGRQDALRLPKGWRIRKTATWYIYIDREEGY